MKQILLSALTSRPQKRKDLCRKVGCSDRVLRRLIRELRLEGIPVCSNSHTPGYWLGNEDETKHMVREMQHRGLQCLEAARKMELNRQRGEQIGWENVLHK